MQNTHKISEYLSSKQRNQLSFLKNMQLYVFHVAIARAKSMRQYHYDPMCLKNCLSGNTVQVVNQWFNWYIHLNNSTCNQGFPNPCFNLLGINSMVCAFPNQGLRNHVSGGSSVLRRCVTPKLLLRY